MRSLLSILLALSLTGCTYSESELMDLASHSTAKVNVEFGASMGSGSSFAIETEYRPLVFITNAHVCIDPAANLHLEYNNSHSSLSVRVIAFDPLSDLCALEPLSTVKTIRFKTLEINTTPVYTNEGLYVLGYPSGENLTLSSGLMVSYAIRISPFFPSMILSNRVYPGNSGSPILNSSGQVVGVAEAANTTTWQGYGIPARLILELIKGL